MKLLMNNTKAEVRFTLYIYIVKPISVDFKPDPYPKTTRKENNQQTNPQNHTSNQPTTTNTLGGITMTKTNTNANTQAQSPWLKETYKRLQTTKLSKHQQEQADLILKQITTDRIKLTELKEEITTSREAIKTIKSSNIKNKEVFLTDYQHKYNTKYEEYTKILDNTKQLAEQYNDTILIQDSAISLSNLIYAISHDNLIPEKLLTKWNNTEHNYTVQTITSKEGKTYHTINLLTSTLDKYGHLPITQDPEITLTNVYQESTQTNAYYSRDRWTCLKPELRKAFTQTVIHYAEQIINELQSFIAQEQNYTDAEPNTPASTNLDQRTTAQRLRDVQPEVWELEALCNEDN